ncbi:MAG TPA: HAMP domain-containing histidine kinase [Deltaproteobacteria bacterium]|nr:HAMP domain-containing histidine kinase [Deltaproteobacteria bacterium]
MRNVDSRMRPRWRDPARIARGSGADSAPGFRIVDWFLAESLRSGASEEDSSDGSPEETLRRARMTIVIGLVGCLAVLGSIAVTTDLASPWIRAGSYAMAISFLVAALAVRSGLPLAWAQHWLIGSMVVYVALLAAATGGSDTGAILIAILVPLFSTLLLGLHAGVAWSLVVSAVLASLGLAIERGFQAPVHPDLQAMALWNLWAGIFGILGTLGVAFTYEWLRRDTIGRLERAQAEARELGERQRRLDERFRVDLQRLVEERTRELAETHDRLRKADRLASLGILAAGVAHQINNPTGAILLGSQLALACESDPDRDTIWRDTLESNAAEAARCGRIVKNLLRFSSSATTEKTVHDLNDLVRDALHSFRSAWTESRLELAVELCRDSLPVFASAIEIEQAIVNLVRNAVEADPGEAEPIRVVTGHDRDLALLHVIDSGRGIGREDREHLFEPFYTTRGRDGGTGLGLSIVQSVVQGHLGSIDVESGRGEGTRFTISLPLAVVA